MKHVENQPQEHWLRDGRTSIATLYPIFSRSALAFFWTKLMCKADLLRGLQFLNA